MARFKRTCPWGGDKPSVSANNHGEGTRSDACSGKAGKEADVVLGFKTLKDYVTEASPPVTANGGPYFGETIGRYGNRIADGKFTLDQPGVGPVTYTLPINNGVNSLHGGLVGFGDHIWSQEQLIANPSEVGVTLQLTSPNGDSSGAAGSPGCPTGCTGYPAEITVDVTFTLNNHDQLGIRRPTPPRSRSATTSPSRARHSTSAPRTPSGAGLVTSAPRTTPRRRITSSSSRRATTTTGC
jgi:hypothetical protein